ncbi:MAG TPA: PVC-type heme-binding CxxCH protein [Verrucomicrobiales bacterium]|nr:PVC-type heme-binding CxxCH protein [Verrucomicrobiales bacterium]
MKTLNFALLVLTANPLAAADFLGRHFTVADGYTLSVAAPPELVERPIEACFDDKGRLYVTESSGSNEKVEEQLKKKPHRLLRLEDTNGDGVFDKRTVFADGLMFPEGVLWHQGVVYVAAPPQIWKFTDTDDNGVADTREVWYDGKTLTGCANDLHGPYAGPDGFIYWCKGAFAEQTHDLPQQKGWKTRASHVFRMKPDGTEFDSVFTAGMDNPVGVAWTPEGDLIVSGTFLQHPGDGKRDGLIHAVRGGVWGKDHNVLDGHIRTGPLMPPMTHMGPAAPCGMCRYGRDLLVCQFNLRKVSRHVLEPLGSTWKTTDSDLLVSDHPDFHPTDVLQAPDGSVLVVDTGGWYKLCCPTSQIARPEVPGAIYRLRKNGGEVSTACPEPRWKLAKTEEPADLVEQAKSGDEGAAEKALEALLKPLAEQAKSSNLHIRRMAIEALGQWPARHRFTPEGGGRLPREGRAIVAPLLAAAAAPEADRFLEHALTYALIEGADARGPRVTLSSDRPMLQRMGLYWVSQTDPSELESNPDEIGKFLSSPDAGVREAAAFLLQKAPQWRGQAGGWVRKFLTENRSPEVLRPAVEVLMNEAGFRKDAGVWLAAAKTGPLQQMLLDVMAAAAARYEFPREWVEPLLTVLESGETATAAAAVFAAKPLKKMEEVRDKLANIIRDAQRPASVRLLLMQALSPVAPTESEFTLLMQTLAANGPDADRAAAVLSRAKLTAPQLAVLAPALAQCSMLRRPLVLRAFAGATDETLGLAVVDQLEKSGGLTGLSAQDQSECLGKFPDKVQQRIAGVRGKLNQGAEQQKARIDELEKVLPAGDNRRGAVVFQSPKASCSLCHQAGYLGRHVGPDLSKIGGIRTRRDLLESIAFPSASFVRSYEPVEIKRKDGTIAYGVVRSQNAQAVTLVTGAVTPDATVAAADTASMNPGALSLMPQGIDLILTPQELADVVAFLESLK